MFPLCFLLDCPILPDRGKRYSICAIFMVCFYLCGVWKWPISFPIRFLQSLGDLIDENCLWCISFSNEMLQPLLQCWRFILRLFDLDFHSYQFYCRKNVEQVNKRLRKLCGFRALCNQENKHLFHKSGK